MTLFRWSPFSDSAGAGIAILDDPDHPDFIETVVDALTRLAARPRGGHLLDRIITTIAAERQPPRSMCIIPAGQLPEGCWSWHPPGRPHAGVPALIAAALRRDSRDLYHTVRRSLLARGRIGRPAWQELHQRLRWSHELLGNTAIQLPDLARWPDDPTLLPGNLSNQELTATIAALVATFDDDLVPGPGCTPLLAIDDDPPQTPQTIARRLSVLLIAGERCQQGRRFSTEDCGLLAELDRQRTIGLGPWTPPADLGHDDQLPVTANLIAREQGWPLFATTMAPLADASPVA